MWAIYGEGSLIFNRKCTVFIKTRGEHRKDDKTKQE